MGKLRFTVKEFLIEILENCTLKSRTLESEFQWTKFAIYSKNSLKYQTTKT
jgi:hypothetical protein